MNPTFAQALRTPGLPNAVECDLVCQKCQSQTRSVVRGIAATVDGLPVLGDLRCSSCGSDDLAFGPEDQALALATVERLRQSPKPLPNGQAAFLRGGKYSWLTQSFDDPRKLRAAVEAEVKEKPDSAEVLFKASIAMIELRDFARAREFLRDAHEKAPDSPHPLVLMADLMRAFGEEENSRALAKEALLKKDGPLLVPGDRTALLNVAARLAAVSDGDKIPKIGRNEPCPCGSGKKYKKCCGN